MADGGFFGGLAQGGVEGAQLTLQIKEQQARVQARLGEIKKEKFNNSLKLLKASSEAQAIGTKAGRQLSFELGNQAATSFGLPTSDVPFDDSNDFSAVSKEISNAIKAFEGKTTAGGNRELLETSLRDAYDMARDILTPAETKELRGEAKEAIKGAEERRGQSLLAQVQAGVPQLQEAGVITPVQAAEARIQGLQEAGALKALPAPGREQARTEAIVSPEDGKVHKFQFNPKTGAFDIDIGLAAISTANEFRTAQAKSKILERFNADPAVRRAESMITSSDIIVEAVASNNPVANASLPTLMARASGEVGNLSEADKAPFGGSRALAARMKQVAEELSTGLRTEENLKFIEELAVTFRKAAERAKERIARERSAQFSKGVTRDILTEKEIFGFLAPLTEFEGATAELDSINKELEEIEKELNKGK